MKQEIKDIIKKRYKIEEPIERLERWKINILKISIYLLFFITIALLINYFIPLK